MSKLTPELQATLEREGYQYICEKKNVGVCGLLKFIYTTGLCIGLDEYGYHGRFCYESGRDALVDIISWDGDGAPSGDWLKYKGKEGEFTKEDVKEET